MAECTDITVRQELRLCSVKGRAGYFHAWEHFSRPLPASPFVGGEPAGVFSRVYGIVEFSDGVRRVPPEMLVFCDDVNKTLQKREELHESRKDWE